MLHPSPRPEGCPLAHRDQSRPLATEPEIASTRLTITAWAGNPESYRPSISKWYRRTCESPAGLTVSASLPVAMAACAPPIEVARGMSTLAGHGEPGSWTRLAASAAPVTSNNPSVHRMHRQYPGWPASDPFATLPAAMKHPLRKVVIPAAGLGTRFLPATKAVPKEMLPIVDQPTLQLIVDEALKAGAQEVVLVNGRGKGAIEDHFDRAYELEDQLQRKGKKDLFEAVRRISDSVRLISVRQKEPLGLGHAVLAAQKAV